MRDAIGRVLRGQDRVAALHTDFNLGFDAFPDASVDAICTDPPYERRHWHTYQELLDQSDRVLKPGGYLLMILPHLMCDPSAQMLTIKDGSTMRFRWPLMMSQLKGNHPRLCNAKRNIRVTYKMIGWWIKEPARRDYSEVCDSFENDPPPTGKQKLHKWQQSTTWAEYCLRLAGGDDWMIVDPMMGAGTVPFVAREMGMRCVGMDLDAEAVATARERLGL